MTPEQLQTIILLPPDKAVTALKVKELNLPSWRDKLVHQYNPLLHPIMVDFVRYPIKKGPNGEDTFRRVPLGFQKLAVNKEAQALYYNDAERRYSVHDDPSVNSARDLLEDNIKNVNAVDSTNIERAKRLFRSCQVATIYRLDTTRPSIVDGQFTNSTLEHKLYSPDKGYELFPYFSGDKKLVGLGINYTSREYVDGTMVDIEYFHLHLVGAVIVYRREGKWEVVSSQNTGSPILLATYMSIEEPIWGGDEGSKLIEILEELRSKNQMFIDKNQVPMYEYYKGKNATSKKESMLKEKDEDSRRIVELGEGGFVRPVSWKGAENANTEQYTSMLEQYYQQIQIFDNRPNSMQTKAMSAENKEILMFDARARAKDLSGELCQLHKEDFDIYKHLTAIQFPSSRNALEYLVARTLLTPYSLHTKQDIAEYVQTCIAAGSMSKRTGITLLNEADSVEQELDWIAEDDKSQNNF